MPNWCENETTITGSKEEIKKIKEGLTIDRYNNKIFSFNNYLNLTTKIVVELKKVKITKDRDNIKAYIPIPDDKIKIIQENKTSTNTMSTQGGEAITIKFLPKPKEWQLTMKSNSFEKLKNEKFFIEPFWYDENLKGLGTKWDVEFQVTFEDENNLHLYGDSAWAPPLEGYKQLINIFPSLHISSKYSEPGCDFAGEIEYYMDEGILFLDEETFEYSSSKNTLKYEDEDEEE